MCARACVHVHMNAHVSICVCVCFRMFREPKHETSGKFCSCLSQSNESGRFMDLRIRFLMPCHRNPRTNVVFEGCISRNVIYSIS